MDTETLFDQYTANNARPAWIRRHRDELQAATGLEIPQHLADIENDWLPRYKSVLTRKLNPDDDRGDE